jgi:nitroreductase
MLEAARLSPSGGNEQPWMFGVITDRLLIKQISKLAHGQKWIASAPIRDHEFIVCLGDLSFLLLIGNQYITWTDRKAFMLDLKDVCLPSRHSRKC